MTKPELIDLHNHLHTMKTFFETVENAPADAFAEYNALDIDPTEKAPERYSKDEHRYAIFVLGQELAAYISDDEFDDAGRREQRMAELAADARADLDTAP